MSARGNLAILGRFLPYNVVWFFGTWRTHEIKDRSRNLLLSEDFCDPFSATLFAAEILEDDVKNGFEHGKPTFKYIKEDDSFAKSKIEKIW